MNYVTTRSSLLIFFFSALFCIKESFGQASSVITRSLTSVVVVQDKNNRLGSGFYIEAEGNKKVVTNIHVLAGMTDPTFILADGRRAKLITISGYDEVSDVVIAELSEKSPRAFHLAASKLIKVGQKTFALGAPAGLTSTVTAGIVSAIRLGNHGDKVIQTDAAINPGNSGGPLINEVGEVIGVVSSRLSGASNLGFAAHVDSVKNLLNKNNAESISLPEFTRRIAGTKAYAESALPNMWESTFGSVYELKIKNNSLLLSWVPPMAERHLGERAQFHFELDNSSQLKISGTGVVSREMLCIHPSHGSRILSSRNEGVKINEISADKIRIFRPIVHWEGENCTTSIGKWEEFVLVPARDGAESKPTGVLEMLDRMRADRAKVQENQRMMRSSCAEARQRAQTECMRGPYTYNCGYYSELAALCARDGY